MELVFITFESVVVLIGIGVIGFAVLARRIVPEELITVITPLVIDVGIPCLVCANLLKNFNPDKFPHWWTLPLWWVLFIVVILPLSLAAMKTSRRENRTEFGISLFYPNALFVPLALFTGMFGKGTPHLVELFLFALFYPAFFFNTYSFFYRRPATGSVSLRTFSKLLNPILVATAAALLIRLTRMEGFIPGFVLSIFETVGAMSIPLIMMAIGGSIFIDFRGKGKFMVAECLKFVVFKNCVFPLVILALLMVVKPSYSIALILLIESAVPPITAVPIVVQREGGNRAMANQFILSSFIASIVTLPLMILLFQHLYKY